MSPQQPTILVKKADGSSVRLTMEEFRRYQEDKKAKKPENKIVEPEKMELMEKSEEALATSTPVAEVFVNEAKAHTEESGKRKEPARHASQGEAGGGRGTGKEVKSEEVIVKSDRVTNENTKQILNTNIKPKISSDEAISYLPDMPSRQAGKQTLGMSSGRMQAKSSNVKQWNEEDVRPLLEEEITRPKTEEERVLPDKRENVYEAVIGSLKFPVSSDLEGRVQSLIVSRIKDIRTDEQVLEYALREVAKGGLGFSQTQAEELLQAILSFGEIKNFQIKKAEKQIEKLESRVDNFKIEEFGNQPKSSAQIKNYSARPVLHDVVPAPLAIAPEEKRTVGPLEEFSEFRLIDFRRLSADPEKAGKILQDKFAVLKKESFLFYLQAVQAWYRSPLYREYLAIVAQSVENRKKVREIFVSQGRESLQEAEFNALVKLHEHLST